MKYVKIRYMNRLKYVITNISVNKMWTKIFIGIQRKYLSKFGISDFVFKKALLVLSNK